MKRAAHVFVRAAQEDVAAVTEARIKTISS
jgi:hypothetical protein